MKKIICFLAVASAALCGAAEGVWSSQASAVIDPNGVNQAGNPCITAVGSGKGKGYGGLKLTMPLDLTGANSADTIRLRTFQNISGIVVMLRGKNSQAYKSFRLPSDGSEIVLKLDKNQWRFSGKDKDFAVYEDVVFYHSIVKLPSQSLGITSLVIEKNGKKLYEYQSDMTYKPRKNQVYNFGRGGHTSGDLIKHQLSKALAVKPTLAIVMVGTNDVNNYRKLAPIEEYEKNLRKITADLEKSGARVILITPPPCIDAMLLKRTPQGKIGNPSENVLKVCNVVRKVAAEKGYALVEFYDIVNKKAPLESFESFLRNTANSSSEDGVHPTREGYAALSKALFEVIKKNNYSAAVTVCVGDSITYGSGMLGAGTAYGTSYPAQLADLLNSKN